MNYALPDHVPEALVTNIDYFDMPGGEIDPQMSWKNAFSGKGPLTWSPYHGGHWIATGSEVMKFFADFKHWSSRIIAIPPTDGIMLPIQADPPHHAEHRANIAPMLSQSAVDLMEPMVRELTIELIEGFRTKGECEFVSEFCLQLPLTIFLRMVNLPIEDRLFLLHQIEVGGSNPDIAERTAAHHRLHDYLTRWVRERRENPGEDAISVVNRGTFQGKQYTEAQVLSTLTVLMHGGLPTVAAVLGFMTLHLARTPEHRDYIRAHMDDLSPIVQEFLRRYSVNNLGRELTTDLEYKGVTLKAGDRIMLSPSLFNLDESINQNAESIDFSRPARHITFGSGRHTCVGAFLARKELAVFLEEWLIRIPDFEVDPARPPKLRSGPANAVDELWLKWST